MIDAFAGAAVPRRLITAEAFAAVARAAPLALINVVDNRSAREVRLVAAGLATAYASVWTLGARAGNSIVVGSATIQPSARSPPARRPTHRRPG